MLYISSQKILHILMKIFFSNIYEDVLHFQEKDHCFIMVGDFNTRTSNKPDFVDDSGNKYLNIGQLNNTIEITQRSNFDSEVNKHGNKLIDFCRSTNLKIVNGRKSSDSRWADLPIFPPIMVLALLTTVYQMIRYFLSSKTSQFKNKLFSVTIVKLRYGWKLMK